MKINLILFCFSLFFLGCAKEEDYSSNIPNKTVEIDIQTQLKNEFLNPYYHETFESGINTGYGGVVAISNADASTLLAYDLCCPYEAPEINKISIKEGSPTGQCPKCKSVFNLIEAGKVVSGVSTKRLKGYNVSKDGYYYRIRN